MNAKIALMGAAVASFCAYGAALAQSGTLHSTYHSDRDITTTITDPSARVLGVTEGGISARIKLSLMLGYNCRGQTERCVPGDFFFDMPVLNTSLSQFEENHSVTLFTDGRPLKLQTHWQVEKGAGVSEYEDISAWLSPTDMDKLFNAQQVSGKLGLTLTFRLSDDTLSALREMSALVK